MKRIVRHEVAEVAVLRPKDRLTAPAVLPAVSHRDRRPWQRGGLKLPEQRSLLRKEGSRSASLRCDCQHHRGRAPGSGGLVNPGEAVVNVVNINQPKMLSGWDQQVGGQVQGLMRPLAQRKHHRRKAATFPTLATTQPRGWGGGRPRPARGVEEGLSRMRGNSHVRFLGGGGTAMPPRYPTGGVSMPAPLVPPWHFWILEHLCCWGTNSPPATPAAPPSSCGCCTRSRPR